MNCCWLHYSALSLSYSFRGCRGKAPEKPIVKQHLFKFGLVLTGLPWNGGAVILWRAKKKVNQLLAWDKKVTAVLHFFSLSLFILKSALLGIESFNLSLLSPEESTSPPPPPPPKLLSLFHFKLFPRMHFFPHPFRIQLCTTAAIIICIAHHFSPLCSFLCVMSNISHSFSLKA